MQEAELIRAAQAGDRQALIQLLKKVETPLYRTAFYMLKNEHDALDATQEALIKIYKNIHTFELKAKFLTWSQRIITNVCIDKCRQYKENVSVEEHEHVLNQFSSNDVEEIVEKKFLASDLHQAIEQLQDKYRAVIIMRYIQDLSYKEIAEVLDLPLNTVKSYLFRARRQLQEILQREKKDG